MLERLLMTLLPIIINNLSPVIVSAISEAIDGLEKKAAETPNPYDDMLAPLLRSVLSAVGKSQSL